MVWTETGIITILSIISGMILTIGGWFVVSRLNKANTEKAKAETAAIYQDMAAQSAERERRLVERVNGLEKQVNEQKDQINNLNAIIEDKNKENLILKRLVGDLSLKSDEQARKIIELETEVNTLRLKRK